MDKEITTNYFHANYKRLLTLILFTLVSIYACSILAQTASAAGTATPPATTPPADVMSTIKPLDEVLRTDSNIKMVWGHVRNIVNSVVILALIYVAFLNILRINLGSYAIKKFLPALLLAVILTNFSYLICKLTVDFCNAILSLLIDGAASGASGASGSGLGIANAFDFTAIVVDPANLFVSFLYILGTFAGAILIYLLSFLFFFRNYVVYFLIVLSPLAFMAMAMTDTKKFFGTWWSNYLKWVFMPIVSVFWLWLGGVWYSSGLVPSHTAGSITAEGVKPGADFNSNLFAFAFAAFCYYAALTTPFKMGGAVMSNVAKYSKQAAKWGAGVTGIAAGYKYLKDTQQMKSENDKKQVYGFIKEKTGIGKGLEYQKIRQKKIEERDRIISGEKQAEWIKKRGAKGAKLELENMRRDGAVEFSVNEQRDKFINNPRYQEWVRNSRLGAAKSQAVVEMYDANWKTLNNEMREIFFSDNKNLYGKEKDKDGYATVSEDEKKERKKFGQQYGNALWSATVSEAESNKARQNLIDAAATGRMGLDNAREEFDTAKKSLESLKNIEKLLKKTSLTEEEKEELGQNAADISKAGYDHLLDKDADNKVIGISDITLLRDALTQNLDKTTDNFKKRTTSLFDKDTGKLPVYLETMFKKDEKGNYVVNKDDGTYELEPMSKLEKTRTSKFVSGEIMSSGATHIYEQLTNMEKLNAIRYGDEKIGVSSSVMKNHLNGNWGYNSIGDQEKLGEFFEALKRSAGTRSGSDVLGPGLIDAMSAENSNLLREIARNINQNFASMQGVFQNVRIDANQDIGTIAKEIKALTSSQELQKRHGIGSRNDQTRVSNVVNEAVFSSIMPRGNTSFVK